MKRYDMELAAHSGGSMEEYPEGVWVRFEDHEAEIRRLREDRASAIDRLTPLGLENGRLQQRCWALALLLYPSGEAREAVEGDI